MDNDHDILIEMKTILKAVVDDFRSYRQESHKEIGTLNGAVSALEKTKLSIVDFAKHKEENELRVAKLERGYWMALGILALLQFVAPFIINKLF